MAFSRISKRIADFLSKIKVNVKNVNVKICFENPGIKIGPSIDLHIDEML